MKNREIKFRAMATPDEAGKIDKVWYSTDDVGHEGFWALVKTGTLINVCQYTGLKDKNGKEIYEGDIVIDSKLGVSEISFFNASFTVGKSHFVIGVKRATLIEVIGNIYKNKELLK
jgi:hypothetical protein